MSNSTFILTVTDISHYIPLFNLLPYIIGYLQLIVSLWLPSTLTLLLFNLTTFLRSRFSYILVAKFILHSNLILFSSLLVHELTSYKSLYFTFKSFISIIYYVVYNIYTIIIPHHITMLTSHSLINIISTYHIYSLHLRYFNIMFRTYIHH
jgi:hypothetical protein